MSTRVSLAELAASDIRLRPAEAVAIVSAICAQHADGTLRGMPSPGVIRLTRDGEVVAEGPVTTAQDDVQRAAQLLNHLLGGFDALPEYRASGALRIVIARALGTLDLPAYTSLDEFCTALSRFNTEDVRDVARGLFGAWERARASRALKVRHGVELTISDVRRARRATGLSLDHVAAVAEVPSRQLRDLEWGYMGDWPATSEGRAQVIRYARAAGLDESIVLSIAWPMIVEGVPVLAARPESRTALVPLPQRTIDVRPKARRAVRRVASPWRKALVAVAAMIALIAAFALGARLAQARGPRSDGMRVGLSDRTAQVLLPIGDTPAAFAPEAPPPGEVAQSPVSRAVAVPSRTHSRRVSTPSAAAPRRAHKAPLMQRELFRIVIR